MFDNNGNTGGGPYCFEAYCPYTPTHLFSRSHAVRSSRILYMAASIRTWCDTRTLHPLSPRRSSSLHSARCHATLLDVMPCQNERVPPNHHHHHYYQLTHTANHVTIHLLIAPKFITYIDPLSPATGRKAQPSRRKSYCSTTE
jgi:hypothetical protein